MKFYSSFSFFVGKSKKHWSTNKEKIRIVTQLWKDTRSLSQRTSQGCNEIIMFLHFGLTTCEIEKQEP